ncbi:hypothetical protein [uncultured Pseudacidovorax sp.]|uniref:hypothetical protein n=1 Tax=uncultured Pseudacidovorax sp. TaxID=679313 RepID=UPI0025F7CF9D|nr:hypothetical protein [uncultured Pseudacidovorax sp.]
MSRKSALVAMLGLSMLSMGALAHGPSKAQHGGIVQSAGDLSFELVPQGETAALYVVDHDKPADVSKMTGKLTVLNGTSKSEAALKVATGDKLEAATKLGAGSRVVATVNTAAGQAITVRFNLK